jgi:multidrug transporter EmrE-like cation transporter
MYLVWVGAAAVAFTAGGAFMKASEAMTRPVPTVLFYLAFAVGATFQALALRQAELGVAYVVVLGLEAVLAVAFGAVFFEERLSLFKGLGVAAVVAGIVLLHIGDSTREPAQPAPAAQVPVPG